MLRRVLPLSHFPPTLQGAHKILTFAVPTLSLLARGNESIELGKEPDTNSPPFGDPSLVFATIIAMRELQRAGILDALEKAINPSLSVVDRSVLLNHLGSRVGWAATKRQVKGKRGGK
jgi:hypothetical protein